VKRVYLVCDRCERAQNNTEGAECGWHTLTLLEAHQVLADLCPMCLKDLERWLKNNRSEP
jgi:hypothetical protein